MKPEKMNLKAHSRIKTSGKMKGHGAVMAGRAVVRKAKKRR